MYVIAHSAINSCVYISGGGMWMCNSMCARNIRANEDYNNKNIFYEINQKKWEGERERKRKEKRIFWKELNVYKTNDRTSTKTLTNVYELSSLCSQNKWLYQLYSISSLFFAISSLSASSQHSLSGKYVSGWNSLFLVFFYLFFYFLFLHTHYIYFHISFLVVFIVFLRSLCVTSFLLFFMLCCCCACEYGKT